LLRNELAPARSSSGNGSPGETTSVFAGAGCPGGITLSRKSIFHLALAAGLLLLLALPLIKSFTHRRALERFKAELRVRGELPRLKPLAPEGEPVGPSEPASMRPEMLARFARRYGLAPPGPVPVARQVPPARLASTNLPAAPPGEPIAR